MSDHSHVHGRVVAAQAGLIFLEDYVRDPAQAVLDSPMAADGMGEGGGVQLGRAQVVVPLPAGLGGVAGGRRTRPWSPSVVVLVSSTCWGRSDRLKKVSTSLKGGRAGSPWSAGYIVAAAAQHGRDLDLGALERQPHQEQRNGGDLVLFAAHRLLAEYQAQTTGPSRDKMQRLTSFAAGMRTARGLAVDDDQVRLRLTQFLDPTCKAGVPSGPDQVPLRRPRRDPIRSRINRLLADDGHIGWWATP